MRYAACNELVHDRPFAEACALIARHGYQGIELAPYSLADDPLRIPPAQTRELRRTIQDAGLDCVGLHWLLKAPPGLHITTPDNGVRRRSWDAVRSLVDFCREVGGSLLVLGSGKQRGTQGISRDAATAILRDELAALAPHLAQSGVTVLLEPLQVQVTDVLNGLQEARAIIDSIGSPWVASMLDFHNSQDELDSWESLIAAHGDIIRHVHLNEVDGHHPSLVGRPGRARSEYASAFRALAAKGYAGWISLETFHAADSPETVLAETRAFFENMTSVLPGHTSGPKKGPITRRELAMGKTEWVYRGILPAMQCPFTTDLRIDEPELRRFTAWLAGHRGIGGLVTNGHTGEVFALSAKQRAEVTRIVADEVKGALPVVSGINCEGINEACEHAAMAKTAGASGLLVMPPHMWLRFGMRPDHVVDYFTAIGKSSGLDLVVHIYPAWTRAGYSFEVLAGLAKLPWVKCFKIGTREMNKYAKDIRTIRQNGPGKTILTCHDEYLLASMVQGVDGALVGFASFIPDMIVDLYDAVCAGDLKKAMDLQYRINPLKDVVYGGGEPTGDAHARMKMAIYLAGRLESPIVQPPTRLPEGAELQAIKDALKGAGLLKRES